MFSAVVALQAGYKLAMNLFALIKKLIVSSKGFDPSKHSSLGNNTAGCDCVFPLVFVVVNMSFKNVAFLEGNSSSTSLFHISLSVLWIHLSCHVRMKKVEIRKAKIRKRI